MGGFDLQPGHTHCVFRRGASWFALPALSVREVLLRPAVFAVPRTKSPVTGICHVRSEFLPVLNLSPLLGEDPIRLPSEAQMLVVVSVEGNWGLLVDQVAALTSLETSIAPEGSSSSWLIAVLGWATYGEQVVRVLEPSTYFRLAEASLDSCSDRRNEYQEGIRSVVPGLAGVRSPLHAPRSNVDCVNAFEGSV
jgi:chemotaxis signal transduction protein